MIIKLRGKSEITIPESIVRELNLHEGDQLDIRMIDESINISPAVVSPQYTMECIVSKVSDAKQGYAAGEEISADGLDRELAHLELVHELQRGLEDVEAGRVISVDECFSRFKR